MAASFFANWVFRTNVSLEISPLDLPVTDQIVSIVGLDLKMWEPTLK